VLIDCGEHVLDRTIVSKRLALVHEPVLITGSEDEGCAELERVFAKLLLGKSSSLGTFARGGIVSPEKMEEIGFVEFCRLVRLPLVIHEQRKGDLRILSEDPRVIHVPQAHGCNADSARFEFLLVCAQLRDMLAAKDSTVMP
jgi:hypothetical protein